MAYNYDDDDEDSSPRRRIRINREATISFQLDLPPMTPVSASKRSQENSRLLEDEDAATASVEVSDGVGRLIRRESDNGEVGNAAFSGRSAAFSARTDGASARTGPIVRGTGGGARRKRRVAASGKVGVCVCWREREEESTFG